MNAIVKRTIINEIGGTNPALSAADLEKLVSDLAARKPFVKPDRRFKEALKVEIFGRQRIWRHLLRPPVIAAAAFAALAVVIGVYALVDMGRYPWRYSSSSAMEYASYSMAEISSSESHVSRDKMGAAEKEVAQAEPPKAEERLPPPDTGIDRAQGYAFDTPQSRLPAEKKEVKIRFGYLSLTVKEPEKTRDQIIAFTEKLGGYVETAGAERVVVRVPKAAFTAALEEIASYGEVTDKAVETFDVTVAYEDLDLRLKVAAAARDRLYRLLEMTKDVKERFKILKEIQRLTEQVESIGRKLSSLDRLAAFSKITVALKPRVQASASDALVIPFAWVREALELKTEGKARRGSVRVEWPDDFAVLEKEKFTYAENPFGVSLAVYTEENKPRGDSGFWQEAVAFHLGRRFAEATRTDLGKFKAVLLQSNDADPFYLLIAVRADGDRITVCKAVFPNRKQYREEKAAVEKMISGMEVLP